MLGSGGRIFLWSHSESLWKEDIVIPLVGGGKRGQDVHSSSGVECEITRSDPFGLCIGLWTWAVYWTLVDIQLQVLATTWPVEVGPELMKRLADSKVAAFQNQDMSPFWTVNAWTGRGQDPGFGLAGAAVD